jgi:delta14-sterol reductase
MPGHLFLPTQPNISIGLNTFILTSILCSLALYFRGPEPFAWLYAHWVQLMTASLAMSILQAIYVYAISFVSGELLALGGNSGNPFYDVSTVWYLMNNNR